MIDISILKLIRDLITLIKIRQSNLFDKEFYLEEYPDVKAATKSPLLHYIRHGWREGRNPSAIFHTNNYIITNRDVEKAGINPLLHYIEYGRSEDRELISRSPEQEWKYAREKLTIRQTQNNLKPGINIVGYFQTVKGIAEAARRNVLALQKSSIPFSINNFHFDVPPDQLTEPLPKANHYNKFLYHTNLFHVNPPEMPNLLRVTREKDLTGHFNIGAWYWELPEFPEEWQFAFDLVDEIWVGSQFILESISKKSPVPVVKIPPCIPSLVGNIKLSRSDFNLPKDKFLFMCAYDMLSSQERKNPLGAIDAYRKAFSTSSSDTGLVIKINNGYVFPEIFSQLKSELIDIENVYFIESIISRRQMNALINTIDVYVSLHRSEGFGLIPAEAMSLGKPVIMTNWSGNLDFMTQENACGVDYQLIKIEKDSGPYKAGQTWAEPNNDHAAYFMQKLFSDPQYYLNISRNARGHIQRHFSPKVIGNLIKNRLIQNNLL